MRSPLVSFAVAWLTFQLVVLLNSHQNIILSIQDFFAFAAIHPARMIAGQIFFVIICVICIIPGEALSRYVLVLRSRSLQAAIISVLVAALAAYIYSSVLLRVGSV